MMHFLLQGATAVATAAETVPEKAAQPYGGIIGQSLWITLIGILILFISLLVLWGVMELLVRFIKDKPKEEELETVASIEETPVSEDELKMRAAAAAVASIQDYDLKMKVAAAAAGYVIGKK